MAVKNLIAITSGDHNGIGPEVIAKGIFALKKQVNPSQLLVFGDPDLYLPYKNLLPKKWNIFSEDGFSSYLETPEKNSISFYLPSVPKKHEKKSSAFLCGRYIELATEFCMKKICGAMVTGPINKNELRLGGYLYDGHTEMLKEHSGAKSVTMMLAAPTMRVSLVTTHIPLSKVSEKLTKEKILTCLRHTNDGLKNIFGIKNPTIAVMGLNPHASDNGLFGAEEKTIIGPAIAAAKKQGIQVAGPFPPDGFFAHWKTKHEKTYDAIICMYHDQGLIPVKLYDFERCVNVSLGLPIIRTSVDHGVGYDIAGKNIADPSSFIHALKLAYKISKP